MSATVQVQDLADQLQRMQTHLRHSERGALLIASVSVNGPKHTMTEPARRALADEIERALADELAYRLPGHTRRDFEFSSAQLSLTDWLLTLPRAQEQGTVFAHGLDNLPAPERAQAIQALNLGREALRWAGYSVVLWVRPAGMTDLTFQSPNFFAWHSGLFDLTLPADDSARDGIFKALQLHGPATLDQLRQRYLDYILTTFRWLDLRGLLQVRNLVRLKLEDVFVPLAAEKELSQEEIAALGGRGPAEPAAGLALPGRENQRVKIEDALCASPRLVILGDPGSGKSTLLKFLALLHAQGRACEGLKQAQERLPILIPISAYAAALGRQPDSSLAEFLPAHLKTLGLPDLADLFTQELEAGRAIVLLDGLDEVVNAQARQTITQRIQAFVTAHSNNRFVVTSRIAGYAAARLPGDWATLTVRPFERPEIERFSQQWSRAYEAIGAQQEGLTPDAAAERRAAARAKNLTDAIFANESVEQLATTPLLLTLLALIHYQGTRLPERRVELYRLCVEALAETWNLARSLAGQPIDLWLGERRLDEQAVVQVLAPVALWMHERQPGGLIGRGELEAQVARVLQQRRGKPPEIVRPWAHEFVELVREQVGLLVERAPDQFGFMHLTFEEYLSAVEIAGRVQDQGNVQSVVAYLSQTIGNPAWREVTLLTVSYLSTQNLDRFAGDVVTALVERAPGQPGEAAVLAGEAILDAGVGRLPPESQTRVIQALVPAMQNAAVPAARRRQAGLTLGRLEWLPDDLDDFAEVPSGPSLYGDPKQKLAFAYRYWIGKYPVTNAQYKRFMDAGGYDNDRWWSEQGRAWRDGAQVGPDAYEWIQDQALRKRVIDWVNARTPEQRRQPFWWNDAEWNNPIFPVVGITWFEAQAYARWLNSRLDEIRLGPGRVLSRPKGHEVRLLTEQEWERAARGTDGREYPWKGKFDLAKANVAPETGKGIGTTAVCAFPQGVSPAGAWDMSGNVWEWTSSLWSSSRPLHVLRGGSWCDDRAYARCAVRSGNSPVNHSFTVGLRVVLSPQL